MAVNKTRNKPGVAQQRLLLAVRENPGLHPHEYSTLLGMSQGSVNSAAARLVNGDLIRREGRTSGTRLFPSATEAPTANPPPRPRKPPAKRASAAAPGSVYPELLAALGIKSVPAMLIGDEVLVVGDEAFKIRKQKIR